MYSSTTPPKSYWMLMDSTLIFTFSKFHYIEKRHSDRQDIMVTHNLVDYPKDLHKKVTLLQHFKNYLENDAKGGKTEESPKAPKNKDEPPVYVKKWTRTRHAIMFRLSNKIVQVCFEDHTEIILDSESREVTYLNKKGGKATYPLSSALESENAEMTKRLKYTKEILTHMLTGNQPKSSSSKFFSLLLEPSDSQRGQETGKNDRRA